MTRTDTTTTQTEESVKKNIEFFKHNVTSYAHNIQKMDTYRDIRSAVTVELRGINKLLDIGNGGVFDYDTDSVKEIVALDLFLDVWPSSIALPQNVTVKKGSALQIPFPDESFDGVLVSMVFHHLVGKTARASFSNTLTAINEAHRVLKKGGKLVITESCIPSWFYAIEKIVFRPASWLICKMLTHPPAIQYPIQLLTNFIKDKYSNVRATPIPKGAWIMQLGMKFPSALTPAQPYLITAEKP